MSSSQEAILVFFSLADFSWFRAAHQRVFKIAFLIISEAQPCNRIDFLFFLVILINMKCCHGQSVFLNVLAGRLEKKFHKKLYNFFHRFLKIGIT